jgi:SAM-dependent methyltransferase
MTTDIYQRLEIPGEAIGRIDRERYFVDGCRGRRVLHLGCSDWPVTAQRLREGSLLHARLYQVARELVGVDISPEGTELLCQAGLGEALVGDAEDLGATLGGRRFEVVVAGEVLEHLSNPGLALAGIGQALEPGGVFFASVPNAYCLPLFLRFLAGEEKVHRDHCCYYSPKTLHELLRRHGFVLTAIGYSARPTRGSLADAVFAAVERTLPRLCGAIVARARRAGETPPAGPVTVLR